MEKKIIIGCLWVVVIVIYLFLLLISTLYAPMSLFLWTLPPIVVVMLLLKRKPLWVKSTVIGSLLLIGVDTLFDNDIIGPMEFMIRDRPINTPGQFYYSWRYYWVMMYFYIVAWRWGSVSVIFIILRKVFLLAKRLWVFCRNKWIIRKTKG